MDATFVLSDFITITAATLMGFGSNFLTDAFAGRRVRRRRSRGRNICFISYFDLGVNRLGCEYYQSFISLVDDYFEF